MSTQAPACTSAALFSLIMIAAAFVFVDTIAGLTGASITRSRSTPPNPLRTEVAPAFVRPQGGRCALGDAPGIGGLPDLSELAQSL